MKGTNDLVIDGNNASRGMLVTLLREFSVGEVAQARRAQDARRILELQRFDIVACDYHFEGEPVGAELWLRLGKPQAAQNKFDAILEIGAVPWARLGIARSQYDRRGTSQARRSLESLFSEQPGYADAYDVMAGVLLDQGLSDQALSASCEALSLTPGSVAYLVKHGLLASSRPIIRPRPACSF